MNHLYSNGWLYEWDNEQLSHLQKDSIHLPFWVSLIVMKPGHILSHTFQSHLHHFSLVHMFSSYKDAFTKKKKNPSWYDADASSLRWRLSVSQLRVRAEHLRSKVSLKIYSFIPTDFFKYICNEHSSWAPVHWWTCNCECGQGLYFSI